MMKKIFTIFLALTMAVSLFTGCGKKNDAETGEADSDKLLPFSLNMTGSRIFSATRPGAPI